MILLLLESPAQGTTQQAVLACSISLPETALQYTSLKTSHVSANHNNSKQVFSPDTLDHDHAPPYQVQSQKVEELRKYLLDKAQTYIVIPLYPHPFCTHPPANATGCLKIAHLRKFCVRSLVDVSHDLEVELHHVSAGNQESKGCCYLWQQTVLLRPEVQHLYLPCPAV